MQPIILLALVTQLGTLPVREDGLHRVGTTRIEGRARQRGDVVVLRTAFGDLHVPAAEYGGLDEAATQEVFARHAELVRYRDPKSAAERRVIAAWCRDQGLFGALREELEALSRHDITDPIGREFLAGLAPRIRLHPSEDGHRDRDRRDFVDALFGEVAPASNVGAILAAEKLRRLPAESVLDAAVRGLRSASPRVRWMSANVLGSLQGPDVSRRVRPLFDLSLRDGSQPIRREAVAALRSPSGDAGLVALYAQRLETPEAVLRVRAADALGELADARAVPALINALANTWKPARGTVVSLQQTAYVKDYDVEVAQSAFIADPVVDVVQSGAALEVAVISVQAERRILAGALRRLTGADLGERPEAWRARFPTR